MRRVLLLAVCVCVLSVCQLSVSAHRGGTDANGGHTNKSTGTYHYHHGYSAHNHYDMNGDGTIDCPYDFKDNAREDVKSSSDLNKGSKNDIKEHTKLLETDDNKQQQHLRIIVNLPFLVAIPAFCIMSFSWVVSIFSQDLAERLLVLGFRLIGAFLLLLPIWGLGYLIKLLFNL